MSYFTGDTLIAHRNLYKMLYFYVYVFCLQTRKGNRQFKGYKQPGKFYIGVELLHVAQIYNDVK